MTAGSYRLEPDRPELGSPVLVHGLTGFMDAGGASRLAIEHLLESCENTRVATFDIDSLFDYRGRRPRTVFASDHYESVDMPELVVDAAVDERGERFRLDGSEPDTAWGAVSNGIIRLADAGRAPGGGDARDPLAGPAYASHQRHDARQRPDADCRRPTLGRLVGGSRKPCRPPRAEARRAGPARDGLRRARSRTTSCRRSSRVARSPCCSPCPQRRAWPSPSTSCATPLRSPTPTSRSRSRPTRRTCRRSPPSRSSTTR